MRDHIPLFEQYLAARRHAPRTVRAYAAILKRFVDFTNASVTPTRGEIESFLARPQRNGRQRAAATHNHELAALRAFAKFAVRDLGWENNATRDIPFAKEGPRDPPVLSFGELQRLFSVAGTIENPVDRAQGLAILALLSQAGLRVHELVALNASQVDLQSATLVAVRGKGDTVHDVPLNAPSIALLTGWLTERSSVAPPTEEALFISRAGRRISIRTVQRMLVSLRNALGTAKRVTPHTLRHTTATLALTLGADLSTVADLLRHTDLNTTRKYLHLVDERRREAVRRLGASIPADLIREEQSSASGAAQERDDRHSDAVQKRLDAQEDFDDAIGAAA